MTYRPNPGYQASSRSSRNQNINSVETQHEPGSLADDVNFAATTHHFPSVTGAAMGNRKALSFSGIIFGGGGGAVTLTVWATNDEDTTSGDWVNITKRGLREDGSSGHSSITAASGVTEIFAFDFDNLNYEFYYIEAVCATATNTIIIKERKKAL